MLVPGRQPAAAAALDPVLTTPDVPSPMAMALIDRDPNWFLPGIGEFPVDRATLLSPDDEFAEAVMLGANEELLNEFLWREFPTDRRGTPIRRFWPRPGAEPDIGPIHQWTGELGSHMVIDGEATTVILIRAELFRRYPATVVLAAPAEPDPANPGKLRPVGTLPSWLPPLFTVPIDGSTRAVAFAVRPEQVTVSPEVAPGWFFVLVEPPTSIRFGFDAGAEDAEPPPPPPPPPRTWNDLTWDGVLDDRGMASARDSVTASEEPAGAPVWGGPAACAADVARIALQRPVRVRAARFADGRLSPMATTAELRRGVLRAESELDRDERALRGMQDLAAAIQAELARMTESERQQLTGRYYADQLDQLINPNFGRFLALTTARDSVRGGARTRRVRSSPRPSPQSHRSGRAATRRQPSSFRCASRCVTSPAPLVPSWRSGSSPTTSPFTPSSPS